MLVEYFAHPDWVVPGVASTMHVGVLVGPGPCWEIESAGVEQRGDTLLLGGTAVERPSAGGACDRTLRYDTLTVALPPLAGGRYVVVAGDLSDALIVGIPASANTLFPVPRPFAAHGAIVIPPALDCTRFEPRHPILRKVAGALLNPPDTIGGETRGRLVGTLLDSTLCSSGWVREIHVRDFIVGVSTGDTQPLSFEYVVHPGRIEALRSATLEAGAFVGPNSCWEILEAGLVLRADTLALSGTSIFIGDEPCTRILVYETLQLPIPRLQEGEYRIVSEHQPLVDTLVVRPFATSSDPYFVALGTLCPPQGDWRCGEPEFSPLHPGASRLWADVEAPSPVDRCTLSSIAGVILYQHSCSGEPRYVIRLRGWESVEG